MKKDITDWQNLWKEEKSTPVDVSKLIENLNTIEKKGKLERIALLITIPVTIILLAILLPILSNKYYLASIVIIGFGMIMILIQLFKSKQKLISHEAEFTNHKYIETLIDQLKHRMLITSKYMWFYTVLLIIGINVGYLEILGNFKISVVARIITHVFITGVMLYFMYYSIEKRKKKNKKGILPLIELLERLK